MSYPTTAIRRAKGFILLAVLADALADESKAQDYDHNNFRTCSIGFAVDSKRLGVLALTRDCNDDLIDAVTRERVNFGTIERKARSVFGDAVYDGMICGYSPVQHIERGRPQLVRAVELLMELLGLPTVKVETVVEVEVDVTLKKLIAHRDELKKLLKLTESMSPDARERYINADAYAKLAGEVEVLGRAIML